MDRVYQLEAQDVAEAMEVLGKHIKDNETTISVRNENDKADCHIYIGFLKGEPDKNGPCCGLYPGACMKKCYTKSNVQHVEVMFILHGIIYTFTINSRVGHIHAVKGKAFSRDGWEFVAIPFPPKQIAKMYNYAAALAECQAPYNPWTICTFMFVDVRDMEDESFHCAQFVTRVLQEGGLFTKFEAASITDAKLYEFVHSITSIKVITEFDPVRNIVK